MGGGGGGGNGDGDNKFETLVLGGLAGSIAEIFVMPPMVIRTRMMVQGVDGAAASASGVGTGNQKKIYSSFLDAVRTMYRTEGIRSFYKGLGINFCFTPMARGLYLVGLETSQKNFGSGTAVTDFVAGMNAQLVSSIAYVPRDIIVERCAIDGRVRSSYSCSNSTNALKTIFTGEGIRGFFRAFLPHQAVWVPFNGLFFAFLGKIRNIEDEYFDVGDEKFSSGYAVGVVNTFLAAGGAAFCTNPIDVIKTRMQVAGANPEIFGYTGPIDCLKRLLQNEGPSALFSGFVGRILYAGTGFAVFLPTYDVLKKLYYDNK